VLIFYRKAPGKIGILQLGPWPGYTGKPIGGVQIPARGLTGGEGEVRGNVQELTAVTEVVGVGEERDCGGVWTANRDGWPSSEGHRRRSGGRRARGGGGVARKLPRDDVVLMVGLAGAEGLYSGESRRGRAAAELELAGAARDDARVRESEIGWTSEMQGVTAVLLEHWIVGGRRRGRLTTAARGCDGAPARSCAREKEMPWKRSASVSKQDCGAAAEHGLRPGEALRARAGAGDTGGTRGGSGGGGATWRGRERPARGREGGGQGAGVHVARPRAARGRPVRGTWPARVAGVGCRETEEEGTRGRRRGSVCNFPKVQGLLCKT
jgi:hypothetical protein